MKPAEIGQAYNQITELWMREEFNRDNGIAAHKRAIAFVDTPTAALDVGCGCTGRFIDLLVSAGFSPEGVDVSDKMLALAKQRHPDICFHHKDICQWTLPQQYSLITAWDSIWHIPLDQQRPVISKLAKGLLPGGVLIFSFGGTDAPSEHCDDFMGPQVCYSTLGVNGFVSLLIELGCECRHLEFDQHPELHSYLIVQKPHS